VNAEAAPAPVVATVLDRDDLRRCVERLAREIEADHPDGVVLVGVLKGALIFLADLARAIRAVDVFVDFLAISRFAPDSGRVRIVLDADLDLSGRDVVVVEDLVDTGLTLGYLLGHLRARGARRIEVCTLLDRPARRILPLPVRYVGLEIPDVFVLGYGLHDEDRFRNLERVLSADRRAVRADPSAFVRALYRGAGTPAVPPGAGDTVNGVVSEAP